MPEFQIQIERLTDEPDRFEFAASGHWWVEREGTTQDKPCVVEAPFLFDMVASRCRDEVLIEGDIKGRVGLECSRCARRYPHVLHDTYRLVLTPAKDHESTDPEGERGLAQNGVCLGEDLEAGLYRGPVIRLDDFLGEAIALAMPIQPLCDEACLGICPHCGVDRNGVGRNGTDVREKGQGPAAACDCEDERIESPFAVLASLKPELGSEEGE